MSNLSPQMTRNVFHYRTGTFFSQKHTASKSPPAFSVHFVNNQTVSLHILSGCQHKIISGMITERHNVACRLIMKAISKGSLAVCIVHMDAGSTDRFAQQNLQIPEQASNRTLPIWLLMLFYLSETDLLPVALMLFWLLSYLLNLNHLPLPTCNRCSRSHGQVHRAQEGDTPHRSEVL